MMATILSTRSTPNVDPAVDLISPTDGLIIQLPAEKPKPEEGPTLLDRVKGVTNYTRAKVKTITESEAIAKAFSENKVAQGSVRVGIIVHAHAARAAVGVALAVVSSEGDAKRLQKVDAGLAALTSCGGAALLTFGAAGTGGVLAVAAGMQWLGCGKNLIEYISLAWNGENIFKQPGFQEFGLSIEAVSLVGSVLSLGAGAVGKGASFANAFRSAFGRGDTPAKLIGRLSVGLDAGAVTLNGVKYVLTPTSEDNALALELASPSNVRQMLDEAGLRRSSCFFPWPIQQQSLFGSCAPWELDRYDRKR